MLGKVNITLRQDKPMPTGLDDQGEPIKPGAKGWCMRARVPK